MAATIAFGNLMQASVPPKLQTETLDAFVNQRMHTHPRSPDRQGSILQSCSTVTEQDVYRMLIYMDPTHHEVSDSPSLVPSLQTCAKKKDPDKGSITHAKIQKTDLLLTDVSVGCMLVNMYAKCGVLAKVAEVFDGLPVRNEATWSALIVGYAEHDYGHEILIYFEQMLAEGFTPDPVIYSCILKACARIGAADKGKEIHSAILMQGLLGKNLCVSNALVDMYAKCGLLVKAREVFDELPVRNVICWNALITGYTQHGYGLQALECFEQMQKLGISPNVVTFTCILKACSSVGALDKGSQIHAQIARYGFLRKDVVLGNTLVDMYCKCGDLLKAQEVFDHLPMRDVVTWNALIAGYAQHGHGQEALEYFEMMQSKGLSPNAVTFSCILKACGSLEAVDKGKRLHAEAVRQGWLEINAYVGNALVDMYAKFGLLAKAQEVFELLPVWNLVSWNALISGYALHGHGYKTLNCFERMQDLGISPNSTTFTCILKACGSEGLVKIGEEIHGEVLRQGLLGNDVFVGNALVDMYAKCGALGKAQAIFDELPVRNIVSWNALVTGYGQLGKVEVVIKVFNKMIAEGVEPDLVTFIVLLNACSHSGLVEKGQLFFDTMSTMYGVFPSLKHHSCLVDLYGRAELFEQAVKVIEKLPPADSGNYLPLWSALLGACQKWGNPKLGRQAFERVVQLDKEDPEAYICMRNIYLKC